MPVTINRDEIVRFATGKAPANPDAIPKYMLPDANRIMQAYLHGEEKVEIGGRALLDMTFSSSPSRFQSRIMQLFHDLWGFLTRSQEYRFFSAVAELKRESNPEVFNALQRSILEIAKKNTNKKFYKQGEEDLKRTISELPELERVHILECAKRHGQKMSFKEFNAFILNLRDLDRSKRESLPKAPSVAMEHIERRRGLKSGHVESDMSEIFKLIKEYPPGVIDESLALYYLFDYANPDVDPKLLGLICSIKDDRKNIVEMAAKLWNTNHRVPAEKYIAFVHSVDQEHRREKFAAFMQFLKRASHIESNPGEIAHQLDSIPSDQMLKALEIYCSLLGDLEEEWTYISREFLLLAAKLLENQPKDWPQVQKALMRLKGFAPDQLLLNSLNMQFMKLENPNEISGQIVKHIIDSQSADELRALYDV